MESSRKFLVVSVSGRSKKIEVNQPWSLDLVCEIVSERFDVEAPVLSYFDTDVNEWLDLDEESEKEVEAYTVLKVKCDGTHSLDVTGSSLSTSLMDIPSSPIRERAPTAAAVVSPLPPLETPSTSRQPQRRKPWPRVYSLPAEIIPGGVKLRLSKGDELDRKDRRLLMECLYADVSSYDNGMYPTSGMYEEIVDSLFRDFPALMSQNGLSASANRVFIKERITQKFANSRKRVDANLPEVQAKKRPKKSMGMPAADAPAVWGLRNHLPHLPPSEDEASLGRHVNWLQREIKKSSPDEKQVDLLMQVTFPSRRQEIVCDKLPVSEVLDRYPWLSSHRQLMLEFKRLGPQTKSSDLEELLIAGTTPYRQTMLATLRNKKLPLFIKEILRLHGQLHVADQRHYAEDCMVLLGLTVLFKEHKKMVTVEDESTESLYIKVESILQMKEDTFQLMCDGKMVLSAGSFLQIYSGMIAFIYSLNMAYPKSWAKTLSFVQAVILGLKDQEGLPVDKRHLTVLAMLNKQTN